jgi:TetR/AcrR family transcriptional regulator, repressor for uid operon
VIDITAVQHESAAQQKIISAARRLFAERGFHQTAMADLAKEAGVSVGAIYRIYTSKADIILAIIVADSRRLLSELQHTTEQVRSGEITIEQAIEEIFLRRLADREEGLAHEMLAEAHRNPQVAEPFSDFCNQYRQVCSELSLFIRPSLSGDELEGAAELLLASIFGIGHRELSKPRVDEATTARVAASLIVSSLTP